MNFDIRFDFPLANMPYGGVFMTADGTVYQRVSAGNWRGLYRDFEPAQSAHATDLLNKAMLVHRIMTPLEGSELAYLAGWYAGRYHETKQAQLQDMPSETEVTP